MSTRWRIDKKDLQSAYRHVVAPLLAGGLIAAVQVLQAGGQVDVKSVATAFGTAVGAGVLRLIHRWAIDLGSPVE